MTTWPRAMPALITPFTSTGEVDTVAHRHNLDAMHERGAGGVLIGGSTGEGPYLEPGERYRLVSIASEATPDMTVVCGINAESVRQALAQITEAADAGADAALVITPTTLVRSRIGLVEAFYAEVADHSEVPVLIYTVPGVTGFEIPTESVDRLAGHDRIVGMKDSGGDPSRLEHLTGVISTGFVVYTGASRALAAGAAAGAWGAITASANYALTDVSLAATGDVAAQHRLTSLAPPIEAFGVPGTKVAASMVGLSAGHARHPLLPLDEDANRVIAAALTAHGLIAVR